ncbi:hypothetical protein NGTWS1803_33460 [Mycolicibacterium cyprinidarum]|nr:hypothetical protein NGTWS1803_33460 [Mycolicibacterium sp. NGTWS1803]
MQQLDTKAVASPSHRVTVPGLIGRSIEHPRSQSKSVALAVGLDIVSASLAVLLAQQWITGDLEARHIALYSWLFVPIVVVLLTMRSMYRRRLNQRFVHNPEPLETSIAFATLVTLTIMLLCVPALQPGDVVVPYVRPGELMLKIWVCAAVVMPVVHLVRSLVSRYLRRKFRLSKPALIIGSGPIAQQLITRMRQVPDYGLHPVGLLDDIRPLDADSFDLPYYGTTEDLKAAAHLTGASELVVAPSSVSDEQLACTAQVAHNLGMRVRVVPRLMDAIGGDPWVEHVGGVPLMVLHHVNPRGWQFAVKHCFDRVAAGIGLVLISPLFLGLALLVKISSPGPIFFSQKRVGRDGAVFDCLKFRSMRTLDPDMEAFDLETGSAPGGVEGDDRRTVIGRIMRRTSLDELPQLLNVVRGDMSLVGPRPERPEFVELFEMHVRRYGDRHRVKAGITGWAQVHGLRGQTSIADRAEFDNYYIQNWSLHLDFKILMLTLLTALRSVED